MSSIATLTLNPAIDKNTRVERVVAEEKLRCDTPTREPGGGGINVSRAIHRLGGSAHTLYTAGGFTGNLLNDLLDAEDLDHTPISTAAMTRENMIVYETSTDRQFRFGMPGPELTTAEWDECLNALRALDPSPDYLVASGSLPPGLSDDAYAAVADVAHSLGARPILDTSGSALYQARTAGWYLLKPNLRELEQLTGHSLVSDSQRIEAAREMIDDGYCEIVVLSMGASGALLITADRAEHVRSPTVPIKSRVGAGDSMVGGLTLALAREAPLPRAVRYGVAAGAAAVMTPGTELCRQADVETLFDQMTSEHNA
ncbi:phosphofructokinase [Salinibacter sp. 10B]|uniref:1-phosphofructokinase family hexose kinase n=1 Tax=Salinibacter sp. 10B TaxID=1923971 RepID=UPI000CF4DCB6|nr:1-phosphofructokinase family hexose kinase [Salinibacter sp. 10B]PQJ35225.1 phosphofructokinase [Salinibacter sp. 10B]